MELFDVIEGTAWSGFFLFEGKNCIDAVRELNSLEAGTPDLDQRISAVKQRIALYGASALGFLSYTFLWANRVRWIVLGAAAPFIGAVGFGTRIFLSGFKAWDAIGHLDHLSKKIQNLSLPEELEKAQQEQIATLLKLIKHVALVAWSFFALIALIVGPVLLPVVEIAMYLSLIFLLVEMVYHYQFQTQAPAKVEV